MLATMCHLSNWARSHTIMTARVSGSPTQIRMISLWRNVGLFLSLKVTHHKCPSARRNAPSGLTWFYRAYRLRSRWVLRSIVSPPVLSEGIRFGGPLSARAVTLLVWASSRSPVPICWPHFIPANSGGVGTAAYFAPRHSKLARLYTSPFLSRLLVSRTQHDAGQWCSRLVVCDEISQSGTTLSWLC